MTAVFVDNHPNILFRNYAYPTAMAVLFAAAVWLLVPRGLPSPIYLDNEYVLVDGKSLAGNFMPVGYPALLAPAIALMGETWGVLLLQSVFYMIAVLLAPVVRKRLETDSVADYEAAVDELLRPISQRLTVARTALRIWGCDSPGVT